MRQTPFGGFLRIKIQKITTQTFDYIGDVLSLNNSRFGDYLSLIYPNEIAVKNTTDIPVTSAYGVYIS